MNWGGFDFEDEDREDIGLTVESGIPLSTIRHVNERMPRATIRYPWREMQPGDSFYVPVEDPEQLVREMNAATADGNRIYGNGVVSARSDGGGFRVWVCGITKKEAEEIAAIL